MPGTEDEVWSCGPRTYSRLVVAETTDGNLEEIADQQVNGIDIWFG